jgi:hypothetical protein
MHADGMNTGAGRDPQRLTRQQARAGKQTARSKSLCGVFTLREGATIGYQNRTQNRWSCGAAAMAVESEQPTKSRRQKSLMQWESR